MSGGGAFGAVYRGRLTISSEERDVAVKVILVGGAGPQATSEARFRNELAAIGGLRHPNLLRLLAHSAAAGPDPRSGATPKALVTELVTGGSLSELLVELTDWRERLQIGADVAAALQYLHAGDAERPPIIHRDVKPENGAKAGAPGGSSGALAGPPGTDSSRNPSADSSRNPSAGGFRPTVVT